MEQMRKTMIRQSLHLSSRRLGRPMRLTRQQRDSTPALQKILAEPQRMVVELRMIALVQTMKPEQRPRMASCQMLKRHCPWAFRRSECNQSYPSRPSGK